MATTDTAFTESIPAIYDRHLGPFLFRSYAGETARRAAALKPQRILETAAGTGLVTEALARACPDAEIVATDLNQAMLNVASERIGSANVRLEAADAQELPFGEGEFDLVVCQFGIMFFPDRVKGNREARRVLREDGRYLLLIWDSLARNPGARAVHQAVASAFPDNPPGFLGRTPYGYSDPALIEHDLLAAGFRDIEFETVPLKSEGGTRTEDAAIGLVQGSPLRVEVEAHGPDAIERATNAALQALGSDLDTSLSAHIVTAIR